MTKPSQAKNAKRPVSVRCIDSGLVEAVADLDYGRHLVITDLAPEYVLNVGHIETISATISASVIRRLSE
jgi:hypothetical protein